MTTKLDITNLPVVGIDGIKTVQDARMAILELWRGNKFTDRDFIPNLLNKLDALTDTWVEVVAQATALEVKRSLTVERGTFPSNNEMVYVAVISEMISRVGYNTATSELRIVFHDRYGAETSEFSYLDVDVWIFEQLTSEDESAGSFYNEYVKGNYNGRRCISVGGRRMTEAEAEAYSKPSARRSRRLRFGRR